MIDLLYVSHNRRAYTEASFTTLTRNTDWDQVHALYLADDASEDGTAEWLFDTDNTGADLIPGNVLIVENRGPFRGPVAAMNWYLDVADREATDKFVKIDSDFVVCPGWLEELLYQVTLNPGIDVFGLQPRFGPPEPVPFPMRTVEECRWIGGIGVIRHRMFDVCRPVANGRYGWTEFQTRHDAHRKCWITPDLPCFSLDLIDAEPWAGLAREYVANGWQREWPQYESGGRGYFEWWKDAAVVGE